MKKVFSLLLAMALCLMLSAGALADWRLEELYMVTGSPQWVRDSAWLRLRENDGYYVYDVDGNALVQEAFGDVSYEFGYIVAAKANGGFNAYGVLDEAGGVVIPHQYGDIEFLDRNWVLGFKLVEATADHYDYSSWSSSDAYYLIETVDIYNLSAGACVGSLPRANYKDSTVVDNVLQIEDRATGVITAYDSGFNALGTSEYMYSTDHGQPDLYTFRENGQYGLKDAAGNVVMKPSFYNIYTFYGTYAVVSTGEKEGLIDRAGNVIVPAQYEEIKRGYYSPYDKVYAEESYNANGFFAVVQDGKLGWVNAQGQVTCEPKYSEKIMDFYGASAMYTDMENKTHILAADGVDTVVEGYESIYCLDYSAGMLYRVTDADYNYGVIDWHGNIVIPCETDGVELSGDGEYLLVDEDYQTSKLYKIDYVDPAVQAAPAPTEQSGNTAAASLQETLNALRNEHTAQQGAQAAETSAAAVTETPAPAPAVEAPAQASGANAAVVTLIDSAIAMLDADAAANKTAAAGLLASAMTLLGEGNASTMISSALTLLEVDAVVNAVSVKTILETVKTML